MFDFATATDGIDDFLGVRIDESAMFDLHISFADMQEHMESDPLGDGDECMLIDIRDSQSDRAEDGMEDIVTSLA